MTAAEPCSIGLTTSIRAKPFAVIVKRFDGRDREYQRYETAALAELVVHRLRELGLEACVVSPAREVATT